MRACALSATVAVALAVSAGASAQSYPERPVRVLIAFPAGGTIDTLGRIIAQKLTEAWGQNVVIENRPGGGGNIATEAVAKAPPDGYMLLLVSGAHAVNATLHSEINFIRDIAPVASLIQVPNVIIVHPSVAAKTLPELIAYAKANPGKINFASGGIGTTSPVMGELFKMMTGVDMVHVPYRGSAPALNDLLGGQVQVYFSPTAPAIELIRTGKLRALAVTGSRRSEALPSVPTVDDFVRGYEASNWFGLGAPRGTPTEIIDRLNIEVNAALGDPKIKTRFADLDCTVLPGSPAEFGTLIAGEVQKWSQVIKFAGIKNE